MRQRFLPVFLVAALVGCSKSDSNPIVDFGEGEGITYRTATNFPVGPRDLTDWTSDGEWNRCERALFADLGFDVNGPQPSPSPAYTTTYPNPSQGQATWHTELQRTSSGAIVSKLQGVLVDRNYHVLKKIGPQELVFGFDTTLDYVALGLGTNELYRLYYVVYNANGIVIKGHGDVRYSPQ